LEDGSIIDHQYTDGEHLLIADTPTQFVDQIKRCLSDPELRNRIADNAYRLVDEDYSNKALTQRLVDFYNKIRQKTLS
jgi:glycosyltransferase involved in cell wall biosynthesis